MTSALCWDNQGRTRVSGYYLDPTIDFPISGDVAHAFEQRPAAGLLWTLEADRSALVESSAKNLHVDWPTRKADYYAGVRADVPPVDDDYRALFA
jgi:hypothetical protein